MISDFYATPGNIASFDPGKVTGLAVLDMNGDFKHKGEIKFKGTAEQFKAEIMAAKKCYNLQFAFIEKYVVQVGAHRPNASKVEYYIQLIQECFDRYIMVKNTDWQLRSFGYNRNRGRMGIKQCENDKSKRIIAHQVLEDMNLQWQPDQWHKIQENKFFTNDHQTDSFLMGARLFKKAHLASGLNGYTALYWYAGFKKSWPNATYLKKNPNPWVQFAEAA